MKELKETLAKRFYTYLCYDRKSDLRFHDPSPNNKSHHERLREDANRLADIAIKDFKTCID